jgi:hypothetical protein
MSQEKYVGMDKFLRRFLIHVLPGGLVRIRHFGLFANRRRAASIARCRTLLRVAAAEPQPEQSSQLRCPLCSGPMLIIERMASPQICRLTVAPPPNGSRR